QHVAGLVEEGAGIGFRVEIAMLPAPIGPGAGHAVEKLGGAGLAAGRAALQRLFVRRVGGLAALQPCGHAVLGHALEGRGHTSLAQTALGQHVGRHLRPFGGHFHPVEMEHHRAVGIADFAADGGEAHRLVWGLVRAGETAVYAHALCPLARCDCPVIGRSRRAVPCVLRRAAPLPRPDPTGTCRPSSRLNAIYSVNRSLTSHRMVEVGPIRDYAAPTRAGVDAPRNRCHIPATTQLRSLPMSGFLSHIFTWWNDHTFGTWLYTR